MFMFKRLLKPIRGLKYILPMLRLNLLMSIDKLKGKKILMYQLSSQGQLQYMMPYHRALKSSSVQISYYLAGDYDMDATLKALNLPKSHHVPSRIARYMSLCDVFLESEIHSHGPKQAHRIFTGHGQANKLTNWLPENLANFDIYFLHGPLEKAMFDEIIKTNPKATQHIQCAAVGYPKLDALIQGQYNREKTLTRLGLNPNYKTILYAPAWDPGGSLRSYGLKIVQQLLAIEDVNVLVKLHPASLEPPNSPYFEFYTDGKDWRKEFSKLESNSRFKFIDDYLINEYLFASELMVNDFSGVGLEFMVLDRPVIYFDCPEYFDKILPSWNCDGKRAKLDERFNGGRDAGTVVTNLNEMVKQVKIELANPTLHSEKRKRLVSKLMYNPGQGAKHGADIIQGLLTNTN